MVICAQSEGIDTRRVSFKTEEGHKDNPGLTIKLMITDFLLIRLTP